MNIGKKIIISAAVAGFTIGLLIYFIILPTIQDIKKISDAVYAERVDLEKKYMRGQLLKKTLEDFEKIKPEKEKLASIFINPGKELEFITALEKIAGRYNLKQNIQLPTISEKIGEKTYYPLPLEVVINGDFIEILKYLKDLERLNYYFNIASINISLDEKNSEKKSVNAILNGKIYILPLVQAL